MRRQFHPAALAAILILGFQAGLEASLPLPPETQFAVASTRLSAACKAFARSDLGGAWCGAQFALLIDALEAAKIAAPLNLRPSFGVGWSNLSRISAPCQFFAFSLPDESLGTALLFERPDSSQVVECLASASDAFIAEGYVENAEQFAGTPVRVYSLADGRQTRVIGTTRRAAMIANSRAAAKAVLKALSTSERGSAWDAPVADSSHDDEVTFFLRPWSFAEAMRDEATAVDVRDPMATAHRVGWDGIETITGRISFRDDTVPGWRAMLRLNAPLPHRGALRSLSLVPGQPPALASLGSGVTNFLAGRFDSREAMRGFAALFDDANEPGPDGKGLFDDLLLGLKDDPEGPQIDLWRDLFANLGPAIARISRRDDADKEEVLFQAQVRNFDAVRTTLTRFYQDDDRVKERQFKSFNLWSAAEGSSLFIEGESDSLITIRAVGLGKSDGNQDLLYFGTSEKQLLESIGTRLAKAPSPTGWGNLYKTLCEEGKPDAALWGVADGPRELEPAYEDAISAAQESTSAEAMLWRLLLFGTTTPTAACPTKQAPAFGAIASVIGPVGFAVGPDKQGWEVHFRLAEIQNQESGDGLKTTAIAE